MMATIATNSEAGASTPNASMSQLPVAIIIPVRNEARNLPRCLQSLQNFAEIYIVDSQSQDATCSIASSFGAQVIQFHYGGGWPKKRQWAMNTLPIAQPWTLLIDADERMTKELSNEIERTIRAASMDGYLIRLDMHFLGRELRHGAASFWKTALFRTGKGKFECRLGQQDGSMADMEIHEHIVVDGPTGRLQHALVHHNVESLVRYIEKHNAYSNWESRVLSQGQTDPQELQPALLGTQAQRRRWLKKKLFRLPGSSLLLFFYRYFFRLGFLDGMPGLVYCAFQSFQMFHTKAKMYELKKSKA